MQIEEIKKDSIGHLFELSVRGAIASMFVQRRVEPNQHEWDLINGRETLTVRDIGEISLKLSFDIRIKLYDKCNETFGEANG